MPSISPEPVRVKFSRFEPSVQAREDLIVSVPSEEFSVIVSPLLSTTKISSPSPPDIESSPEPPFKVSLPAPPLIVSSPEPPRIVSFPAPPSKTSLPPCPYI